LKEQNENVLHDRAIGEIISRSSQLGPEQIQKILSYQKETGLRFGESAVALGFVSNETVLFALAQQFHYPYTPVDKQKLNPELVTAVKPYSKQAEAFRAIRGQVLLRAFQEEMPRGPLAIISANTADGKTFFAANLAIVLSQLGGRVLLIDADMRGPRQHEVFGVENSLGLSGVLSGRAEQQVIRQIPDLPSLYLLPGGAIPPNPIELVERPAFTILVKELCTKFDYVIVDTPAAYYGADAAAIAVKCGAALCIARQGKSKMSGLQDLMATISAGSVKLAGVIVNEY
jgi:protein-tyrosine kinase